MLSGRTVSQRPISVRVLLLTLPLLATIGSAQERPASPIAEPSSAAERPPSSAEHGREAEIRRAAEIFRKTGEAAVIKQSGSVVFPFGESQPVVKCSPLRACDVELQAGERVLGVAVGDAERWITSPLESGDPESPTPHVIVKPKEYNLATNLVIGTTRRTYHVGLVSIAEPRVQAGEIAYHRHVAFYYPGELVQRWATAERLALERRARREPPAAVEITGFSLDRLNFAYTIKAGKKAPWVPTTVFDDGEHVYIRLPRSVKSADLPAVLVEATGGELAVPNYRLRGDWYVVDGLFRRAELVVGAGRQKRKVEIRSLRPAGGGA